MLGIDHNTGTGVLGLVIAGLEVVLVFLDMHVRGFRSLNDRSATEQAMDQEVAFKPVGRL